MKTVPNQRIVKINKSKTDKKNYYTKINLEAINEASKTLLSKGGFKLYIYLAMNKQDYIMALSSQDFC